MTKTHFKAIAALLKATGAEYATASSLATYFGDINPRFDRQRFLTAAGF